MQSLQDYEDSMDASDESGLNNSTANSENQMQVGENIVSRTNTNIQLEPGNEGPQTPFRTRSLLLATFPWFTSLPMVSKNLSEVFKNPGYERCGFVRHFLL
jgi:hypothetical protein